MDMFLIQLLNGLALGMIFVLTAVGLSLIFGFMGIANFAHGTFYMLGAYFGLSILVWTNSFWLAIFLAPLGVGLVGALLERLVLKRMGRSEGIEFLLVTFGVGLVLENLVRLLWGPETYSINAPAVLEGSVILLGQQYPVYRFFVIIFGLIVALGLMYFLQSSSLGSKIRAGMEDGQMSSLLGIDVNLLGTGIFALGTALAALAGVVAGPLLSAYPSMGAERVVEAFIVVVVGGLGNLRGAIIVGILLGLVQTVGIIIIPEYSATLIYVVMAVVLLYRTSPLAIRVRGRGVIL